MPCSFASLFKNRVCSRCRISRSTVPESPPDLATPPGGEKGLWEDVRRSWVHGNLRVWRTLQQRRPALGGGDSLPLPAWGRVYRRKGLSSHKAILTPKGRFPCPYGFGVCMVFVCLWLLKCPQPAAGWQVFCSAGFVARLICPDCAVQVNRAGRESWLSPPHVALLGSVEDTGRGADPSDDSSARGARAKLEEMQVAHPRSTGPVPVSFASLDVDFSGPFPHLRAWPPPSGPGFLSWAVVL